MASGGREIGKITCFPVLPSAGSICGGRSVFLILLMKELPCGCLHGGSFMASGAWKQVAATMVKFSCTPFPGVFCRNFPKSGIVRTGMPHCCGSAILCRTRGTVCKNGKMICAVRSEWRENSDSPVWARTVCNICRVCFPGMPSTTSPAP